jgi:hypothetical protein
MRPPDLPIAVRLPITTPMDLAAPPSVRLGDAVSLASELAGPGATAHATLGPALGAAAVVLELGGDDDQACAAVLQGVLHRLDDGRAPALERVRLILGERVAGLVAGLVDTGNEDPSDRHRRVSFLSRMAEATPEVLFVAACDRLSAVRGTLSTVFLLGDGAWQQAGTTREMGLWFERRLADIVANRLGDVPVAVALGGAVRQLELLAH